MVGMLVGLVFGLVVPRHQTRQSALSVCRVPLRHSLRQELNQVSHYRAFVHISSSVNILTPQRVQFRFLFDIELLCVDWSLESRDLNPQKDDWLISRSFYLLLFFPRIHIYFGRFSNIYSPSHFWREKEGKLVH